MSRFSPKIAVVDIEATGPDIAKGDCIIQIAAIIIQNNQIIAEHMMYINPECEIPSSIQELTGITTEIVKDAPTFSDVAMKWYDRLNDCIFVAHNLAFDLKIIQQAFKECDIEFQPLAVDSVKLAKIFIPESYGFNLTELSRYCNIPFENAHNALDDALITSEILSFIALRASQLTPSQRNQLSKIIHHLGHNESLFINEPDVFITTSNNPNDASKAMEQTFETDKLTQSKSDYIMDYWQKNPYLIVEDTNRPIDKFTIQQLMYDSSKQSPVMVVLSNIHNHVLIKELLAGSQRHISFLKHEHSYLNIENFTQLMSEINYEGMNQHDLVIIAGVYYWSLNTSKFDLDELNSELDIRMIMRKYRHLISQSIPNQAWHNALREAEKSDIVCLAPYHFVDLSNSQYVKHFEGWPVIITDLTSFVHATRTYNQHVIKMSEWATQFNRQVLMPLEEMTLMNRTHLSDANRIHQLLLDIVMTMSHEFKKIKFNEQVQQKCSLYISTDESLRHTLWDLFVELRKLLNEFRVNLTESDYNLIGEFNFVHKLKLLDEFIDQFNSNALYVESMRIRHSFFQIVFYLRPIYIDDVAVPSLKYFSSILMVSSGNYNIPNRIGLSEWVNLSDIEYLRLPLTFYPNYVQLQIPLEYVSGQTDQHRMEDLNEFIMNELQHHEDIMIVVSNQEQAAEIYQYFSTTTLKDNRQIIAQSVSGNIHKIRRKFIEHERNIVIITLQGFYQENWFAIRPKGSLIIYNLPFLSPDHIEIQTQVDALYQKDIPVNVFEQIQLPAMENRLKLLLTSIQENYQNYDIYLWDQRILTQSYGQDVFQSLSKLSDIKII